MKLLLKSLILLLISPFWIFIILILVDAFYCGVFSYKGFPLHGIQARGSTLFCCLFIIIFYVQALQKIYYKTYRVIIYVIITIVIMFSGCYLFPWWNALMAIPLTIIWFPLYYWILKGLPSKEVESKPVSTKQGVENEQHRDPTA